MKVYKELVAWQKAMLLTEEVYRLVRRLPPEERFDLSGQMRRAAISVPSNIAEGYGRESRNDYIHFLKIARGSLYELETQLIICVRLGFFRQQEVRNAFALRDEIGKMLNTMIRKLQEPSA